MTPVTTARRHVSIHLGGDLAAALDRWRTRWDPVMAARTPPHVTVVYPEETVDEQLLLERLSEVAADTPPFVLRFAALHADDDGLGGVFVSVDDPAGHLETIRDRLLLPPQRHSGWPFHSTIAHPRTCPDPTGCWRALAGTTVDAEAPVDELLVTVTDDEGRRVLHRFPLVGDATSSRTSYAGGVMVRDGRVLLGLRAPGRDQYGGAWDVPGGHVEPGESPRQAVRRELREELGIDAAVGAPWRRIVDDGLHAVLHLWLVHDWSGDPTNAAADEHQEIRWCTTDEVHTLTFAHPVLGQLVLDAIHESGRRDLHS